MSTDKSLPTYGRCYICGHVDHLTPDWCKREDEFTSQQTSVSTEKQETESSLYTEKP